MLRYTHSMHRINWIVINILSGSATGNPSHKTSSSLLFIKYLINIIDYEYIDSKVLEGLY